jgi:hypothetical protein
MSRQSKVIYLIFVFVLAFFTGPLARSETASLHDIPAAFCPNSVRLDSTFAKSFHLGERIVGTYYFYWYDAPSKRHVVNPGSNTDALTDHPPTLDGFSWKSVAWHKKQLSDMEDAGIDMALMVFWGGPSEHDPGSPKHWSYDGLQPLIAAREELLREGRHPPLIGLFYDTSTLKDNLWGEHVDMTTERGKQWFYATVRDFFSCIPPRHWAMIDGSPVVFLYVAGFAKDYDQSFVDYTKRNFANDFGGHVPYIATDYTWLKHQAKGDNFVIWGGALGLKRAGISELGPGYDQSAAVNRKRLIVPRDDGKFYEENWRLFLRRPTPIVMIETWNEFHEGTDICESREYGRKYIELTRKYVALFKQDKQENQSRGKYADAGNVEIVLGEHPAEDGLKLIQSGDGVTMPVRANGFDAVRLANSSSSFIYFGVDESFKWSNAMDLRLIVEYFDASPGTFTVQFDGNDHSAPFFGAYTPTGQIVRLTGTRSWRRAEFDLRRARMWNLENADADFRLVVRAPELAVHSVSLIARDKGLDQFRN